MILSRFLFFGTEKSGQSKSCPGTVGKQGILATGQMAMSSVYWKYASPTASFPGPDTNRSPADCHGGSGVLAGNYSSEAKCIRNEGKLAELSPGWSDVAR